MAKIQRALISVSDKNGLIPFTQTLAAAGIEILSTGGTARVLRQAGLAVVDVSEHTGFPEMLEGRVKTLHPKVHGGLLYLRGHPEHEAACAQHGIKPIDLLVVNLYPFETTIARPNATLAEAIENIDIGGPALLRSAAKNHESVTVITDPDDYPDVARQIEARGETTLELRRELAFKVFERTAEYDAAIASYLSTAYAGEGVPVLPSRWWVRAPKVQDLRYGENPHQRAALYGNFAEYYEQLQGKELSYNNILDATAAALLISEFPSDTATLAIIKHHNPCGVGQGASLREAWEKAFATDNQAPFGGIIAVNQPLNGGCAMVIAEIFSEVIVAPDFASEALAILQKKKNLRLLRMKKHPLPTSGWDVRSTGAESFLVQEPNRRLIANADWRVVTQRVPTAAEQRALHFGWRIVKHVKSNAIVLSGPDRTLGIGAGQMSRVDACRIAVWKASEAKLQLAGSVLSSDAFIPFTDTLEIAAAAGATAIVQPGGSKGDEAVIAAANERGLAMVFTGTRHFRH